MALSACDPGIEGTWEVVGFKRPGISAMGDAEASVFLGSTLEIADSTAAMAGSRCAVAGVTRESLDVRMVEMAYNVLPGGLDLARERVDVLEILCGEGSLGPGRHLIRVARDSLIAPYDGVFFVLARRRDP